MIDIGALLISSGGVIHYARTAKTTTYAGRGGAAATILALGVMFLRPSWGRRNYDLRMKLIKKDASPTDRQRLQTEAIVAWLTIDAKDQSDQNRALFLASMIGTLFWGFGDLFAEHLRAWFPGFLGN